MRLRTLIDAAPDSISAKDGKGCWLEANAADLALFGLVVVDDRGKTDAELAGEADLAYAQSLRPRRGFQRGCLASGPGVPHRGGGAGRRRQVL